MMCGELALLEARITECRRCPRLTEHRERIAREKRRAYRDEEYWGRPVPGFGDPDAQILLVGLAPGAHGANRTGRMFTGDSSGDFLYRALHTAGLASQPDSRRADDGLTLHNAFITAAARCAPPDNKPTPEEIQNCRPYLQREMQLLPRVRVVVALGRIAFDDFLATMGIRGRSRFPFAHNCVHRIGEGLPILISSYHPSQQNTSTGKLTAPMLEAVFRTALDQVRA